MNRGRGGNRGGRHYVSGGRWPRYVGRYVVRRSPAVAHSDDATLGSGSSKIGRRNSEIASADGVTKKFNGMSSSDYPYGPNSVPHVVGNVSPNDGNTKLVENVPEAEGRTQEPLDLPSAVGPCHDNDFASLSTHSELNTRAIQMIQSRDQDEENRSASYFNYKALVDSTHNKKEPSQTVDSGFQDDQFPREVRSGKSTSEGTSGKVDFENSEFQHNGFSFDICEERNRNIVKLKSSLLVKNRAMRNEMKLRVQGENIQILRPGMILLKGYISLTDQVKLIKSCRDLGRGSGGFYQPGYRDGSQLHLKMMCLGKNWDPETSKYGDKRPIDGAKPPPIPDEFQQLVEGAIKKCHDYLESHSKVSNARDILPPVSPNICIINFYTKTGRLGLHQDKDESQESIRKKLPVVSFSLGDSAEFLFGEQRDIDKADKVVLGSGDVLVFGGESRLIFHGVSNIVPDTAPKALLEETDLRPGRVNLTFRKY
ncbi:hypothetical protein Pfo_012316 [Paulownia fortunei]|nr:hypothetical protein Pfo_012316 [Paulownia fortunei]